MVHRTTFKYLTIILSIFILGCGNKNKPFSPVDDFNKIPELLLKGTEVKLANDSVLYDPRTLQIYDSLGVCYDNNGYTGFSIFNLKNGRLVKRFANSGSGDENFNINSLELDRIHNDNKNFTIYEATPPYRILKYNIDSLINDKSYKPSLIFKSSPEISFIKAVLRTDSTIIGNVDFSKFDEKAVSVVNFKSHQVTTGITLTKTEDSRFKEFYYKENISWTKNVLNSDLQLRPNHDDIALFSSKGALIQIFQNAGNKFQMQFEKLYYLPDYRIVDHGHNVVSAKLTKETRYGFNNIAVSEDRIYALYNGKPTETPDVRALTGNIVLVYNWQGEPVQKIKLDRNCFQIAVDPNHPDYLYALQAFKNIGVVKYKIGK